MTGDAVTDANGQASFSTRIPKGADRGGGTAGVLVRTTEFGRATDETVINDQEVGLARRSTAARTRSYHPRHADVAVSALRDSPGRDGTVLGLSAVLHLVRDVPPLPAVGRGASSATAGWIARRQPLER